MTTEPTLRDWFDAKYSWEKIPENLVEIPLVNGEWILPSGDVYVINGKPFVKREDK